MAEYDNNNTFALFKNDQGDNPKKPNYTGTATINNVEYRIAGWIRESKSGVKFISGAVQPKEDQPVASQTNEDDVPF